MIPKLEVNILLAILASAVALSGCGGGRSNGGDSRSRSSGGGAVVDAQAAIMTRCLAEVPTLSADQNLPITMALGMVSVLSRALLPVLGLLMLAGVATNVFQIGFPINC